VQSGIRKDFRKIFPLQHDATLADFNPEIEAFHPFKLLEYAKVLFAKSKSGVSYIIQYSLV
jgi:hypothetical protein